MEPPLVEYTERDRVWHYTGAQALLNIFAKQRMLVSHVNAMNDIGEMRHGWEWIADAWKIAADINAKTDAILPATEDRVYKGVADVIEQGPSRSLRTNTFVLSGSTDGDNLNLWQHYSRSGYALAFDASQPLVVSGDTAGMDTPATYLARWQPVIYEEEVKRRVALWGLSQALAEVDRQDSLDGWEGRLAQSLAAEMAPVLALMKHGAFYAEKGVRMVFDDQFVKPVYGARVSDDRLIQYVSAEAHQYARLPIREVRVGPGSEESQKTRMAQVRTMLEALNIPVTDGAGDDDSNGVLISRSGLPYRS